MKTRASILALATLSALSISAFASTSASAESVYYGGGYAGIDVQRYPAYRPYWPARHEACGCETPVREVIREVPVVRVVVREIPVIREVVREVRVREPVSEPCHCETPVQQVYTPPAPAPAPAPVSEPCHCEAPAQQTYTPSPTPAPAPVQQTYAPQDRPAQQQVKPLNYAARDLQK